MQLEIDVVDAFTDRQFHGNSAAVVIHHEWLSDAMMQSIAAQNNLSETAFLVPMGARRYAIRWFSPVTEIEFCGHATLASASVLFKRDLGLPSIVVSAAAVGELTIKRGDDGFIQMDFPSTTPVPLNDIPQTLIDALPIPPSQILVNRQAYFAVYENEEQIRSLSPHLDLVKTLAPRDLVVTAPAVDYDFISRYFWPANGGDEDPVTGSIHTGLAPFWADRLGKKTLIAYQASKRGGLLKCELDQDRVIVSGKAVHYSSGQISIQDPDQG